MKDYVPPVGLAAAAAKPAKPAKPAKGPKTPKTTSKRRRSSMSASVEEHSDTEDDADAVGGDDASGIGLPAVREAPPPLFETLPAVARRTRPMERPRYVDGDEVVWCPQAFAVFSENYDPDLRQLQLQDDLLDDVPDATSELMRHPTDGTMNAARVLGVTDLGSDVPGLELLRLQGIRAVGEEADGADDGPIYSLPMIEALHCDVDQHCVSLATYRESTARLERDQHCSVFFAAELEPEEKDEEGTAERAAVGQLEVEVEWEGRVFQTVVHDEDNCSRWRDSNTRRFRGVRARHSHPGLWINLDGRPTAILRPPTTADPHSSYKSKRCIWYQQVKNPTNQLYVVDPEGQTDSEVNRTWQGAR